MSMEYFFIYLCLQFLSSLSYGFECTGLSLPWLNFPMRRTEKYCVAKIGLEVREGFYFFGMLMKTVHPNMRKDDMERREQSQRMFLE